MPEDDYEDYEDDYDVAYIGDDDDERGVDLSLIFSAIFAIFAIAVFGFIAYITYTFVAGFANQTFFIGIFFTVPLAMFLGITAGIVATTAKYKAHRLGQKNLIPWLIVVQISGFAAGISAFLTAMGLVFSIVLK
jgi:hypothetical protein